MCALLRLVSLFVHFSGAVCPSFSKLVDGSIAPSRLMLLERGQTNGVCSYIVARVVCLQSVAY